MRSLPSRPEGKVVSRDETLGTSVLRIESGHNGHQQFTMVDPQMLPYMDLHLDCDTMFDQQKPTCSLPDRIIHQACR